MDRPVVRETVGRRVTLLSQKRGRCGSCATDRLRPPGVERGKVCAFAQSMGMVWSNPTVAAVGRRTLDRIVADHP